MVKFNEDSWTIIEALLPEQEDIKRAVLNDFIWFMRRPIKYKDDASKIDDYIHHLHLKRNPPINTNHGCNNIFKNINILMIESKLILIYLWVWYEHNKQTAAIHRKRREVMFLWPRIDYPSIRLSYVGRSVRDGRYRERIDGTTEEWIHGVMGRLKSIIKGIGQFCSYVLIPQRRPKDYYNLWHKMSVGSPTMKRLWSP